MYIQNETVKIAIWKEGTKYYGREWYGEVKDRENDLPLGENVSWQLSTSYLYDFYYQSESPPSIYCDKMELIYSLQNSVNNVNANRGTPSRTERKVVKEKGGETTGMGDMENQAKCYKLSDTCS